MEPKLMNRCEPETRKTKEYGKMWKIILKREEGRVPAKEARKIGKLKGPKGGVPGKSALGSVRNLKWDVSWLKKGYWNIAKTRRQRLPKEGWGCDP